MNTYRVWFINEKGYAEKLKMTLLSGKESDKFALSSIVRLLENVESNSAMANGLEVVGVHIEKVTE